MTTRSFINQLSQDLENSTECYIKGAFISIMLSLEDRDLIVKALREYAENHTE